MDLLDCVKIDTKFSMINEYWSPKIIAKIDNYYIKIAKINGEFTWHTHDDCDEVFIVHRGEMRIDFRDSCVKIPEGGLFVVEKGKEHKPASKSECEIILFERSDVLNTGDRKNEFTKENIEWI